MSMFGVCYLKKKSYDELLLVLQHPHVGGGGCPLETDITCVCSR